MEVVLETQNNSHSVAIGYLLWIFGFMGCHRFYYGNNVSGTIWFFTGGLLGIGWIVDLFLIPKMAEEADFKYKEGLIDYNIGWLLLVFLGIFGAHRFYMGRYISGIVWFLTGGLFLVGWLYDLWNLNEEIHEVNMQELY